MTTDMNPPPLPRRPAGGSGISVRTTILVLLAAFAVLVGVGALIAGPVSTPNKVSTTPTIAAAQVQLEPTSSPGENPFMEPVGQDQTVATPVTAGGQFSSDTPGLFGDSGNQNSCDAKTMISNLQADPPRATAWAGALGVTSDKIPDFVGTLTPVVLRSDTSVTSYGYADGAFTGYPAVLQAGTAVFVDSYGAPTVKCFSGNPLAAPTDVRNVGYAGNAWRTFQPAAVTVIQPATTVIHDYTFIDIHHGSRVHCPGKAWWPHRRHPDWNKDWDRDRDHDKDHDRDHDKDHDKDHRPSCPDYQGPGTDKCRPSDTGIDGKPHPGKPGDGKDGEGKDGGKDSGKDGGKDSGKDSGKDGGKPNGGNGGNGNGGNGTPGDGNPGNGNAGSGNGGNGTPGNGTPVGGTAGTGNPPQAGGSGAGAAAGTPGAGTPGAGGGNASKGDGGKGGGKGGAGQGGAPAGGVPGGPAGGGGGTPGGQGGGSGPVGGGNVGGGHGPLKQGEAKPVHQPAPILNPQGTRHPKLDTTGAPPVDRGQILVKNRESKSDKHESDKQGADSGSKNDD
ncbi:MAG: hypothetical protein QOC83_450 [Pseudonocardiales bacterium]|nr:hypothetical protein [Pseudonocardiales bacterium]